MYTRVGHPWANAIYIEFVYTILYIKRVNSVQRFSVTAAYIRHYHKYYHIIISNTITAMNNIVVNIRFIRFSSRIPVKVS